MKQIKCFVTLKSNHSPLPILNRTLVYLMCEKTDLMGLIKELKVVKNYCNGVANENKLALRDCEVKIEI